MPRHESFVPKGVIPAVLLPFTADLAIDETAFRAHLRDVTAAPGLSAITVNAHSTEAASCTRDEQKRVMAIAADEIGVGGHGVGSEHEEEEEAAGHEQTQPAGDEPEQGPVHRLALRLILH